MSSRHGRHRTRRSAEAEKEPQRPRSPDPLARVNRDQLNEVTENRVPPNTRRIEGPNQQDPLLPSSQGMRVPEPSRGPRPRLADTEHLVFPRNQAQPDIIPHAAHIARDRVDAANAGFPYSNIPYTEAMDKEILRGTHPPTPPLDPKYSKQEPAPERASPLPAPQPTRTHSIVTNPPESPPVSRAQTRAPVSPPPAPRATRRHRSDRDRPGTDLGSAQTGHPSSSSTALDRSRAPPEDSSRYINPWESRTYRQKPPSRR